MPSVRVSQDALEFAATNTVPVRETQDVIEFVAPVTITARVTQDVVEVLQVIQVPVRSTQDVIEVIVPGASTSDISGIYFINTHKPAQHDSYYGDRTDPLNPGPIQDMKIPDPTIRLALLGN